MAQTVKQKIRWGTIFLFVLLLIVGVMSIFHIVRLKNDAEIILINNYESLDYCHTMQRSLDSISIDRNNALKQFEMALTAQEKNITEKGERSATQSIRNNFNKLRMGDSDNSIFMAINASIQQALSLNMTAIEHKNQRAAITADRALTYLSFAAAIIFLVGLTFLYNFPSVVTEPINKLIAGLREITAKNYAHRIHLDRKDEFGQMASVFNEMAGRLETFENSNLNKIIFEKTRAEAVINSLRDASIGIDRNQQILFANSQALRLLGLESSQVVGISSGELSKKNDLFRFLQAENSSVPFKIVIDQRENYFIKEVIEIDQEGLGAKMIVLKNITSFKELDAAKTNLIATISHELKTPLASSDLSIKLLTDQRTGTLNTEQMEYVQSLRQDNERMLKILSELLNMAQIEAGKIQVDLKSVSPEKLVDEALKAVATLAKEKNISLRKNIGDAPEIIADPEKTIWVLNNLLTNAIRYSSKGSEVTVDVKKDDSVIVFTVSDFGAGIATEHLPKIFDRFFRVPGVKSVGNGLGLSISREFIEAQHGEIGVISTINQGSKFFFQLPLS